MLQEASLRLTWQDASMAATQVLDIRVINCGGMRDLMSEMEASFLVSALGLFRHAQDFGKGTPRANVNLLRAYDAKGFYRAVFSDADIVHIIGHAHGSELDVGLAKKRVKATELLRRAANIAFTVRTGSAVPGNSW
jgi:hypothetical protein